MGEDINLEAASLMDGKKKIRPVLRVVVFICIFCVILYFLCDIFEYKNNYLAQRYKLYKQLEPGTVDAVMIGTSGIDRSWIAAKGFEKFGFTVYPFSTDALPCWIALDMIREAYKYQTPKLVVLDMRMFTLYDPANAVELSKTRSRRAIDTLDFFSLNRLDAINRTQKVIHEADPDEYRFEISYFFSFIQYHSMWADEGFKPFSQIGSSPSKYLGFYLTKNSIKSIELQESFWTDEKMELTEIAVDSLNEILEYCSENNIELLFIDTPHSLNESQMKRTNMLCDILDSKDIKYVRYSDREWYNLDGEFSDALSVNDDGSYTVDYNGIRLQYNTKEKAVNYLEKHSFNLNEHFYDASHLNFDGAVIFTRLFGDYLKSNYGLADHTEDTACADWVDVYPKIKKKIKKYRAAVNPSEEDEVLTEEDIREMQEDDNGLEEEENLTKEGQDALENE